MGATIPAEFGRSLGSVLNVVYKSGTQQFHGSGFEFLRDSALDSKNYFQKLRGEKLGDFSRHQFGGSAGGPIQAGKTFFMASYEGLRENGFASPTLTVPTELQRQGDFSQTFAANGQLVRIFNPFSHAARIPPADSSAISSPTTGSPPSMMDPVALNVMKYYPLPNQPGDAVTGRNNYYKTGTRESRHGQHRLPRRPQLRRRRPGLCALFAPVLATAPLQASRTDIAIAEGRVIEENHVHNFVTEYNQRFGNAMLLTARIGFARTLFVFDNQGLGFKPSSLGLPVSIDNGRRPPDVPALRRQQLRVPRRQRPPLQRVHELSGAGQPDADELAAHVEDRARRPDDPRQRVGGASGRDVQFLGRHDPGAEPEHGKRHGRQLYRFAAPRDGHLGQRRSSRTGRTSRRRTSTSAGTRRTTGG